MLARYIPPHPEIYPAYAKMYQASKKETQPNDFEKEIRNTRVRIKRHQDKCALVQLKIAQCEDDLAKMRLKRDYNIILFSLKEEEKFLQAIQQLQSS